MVKNTTMMKLPSSFSSTVLAFQVAFLLYYHVIFGFVLTILLRLGFRIGFLQLVKKKKAKRSADGSSRTETSHRGINEPNNEQEGTQEETLEDEHHSDQWHIATNFKSFFSNVNQSIPFLQLKYQRQELRTGDANHTVNQQKAENHVIPSKNISVETVIPTCKIKSLRLSPLASQTGKIKRKSRTYLLSFLLDEIALRIQVKLKIDRQVKSEDEFHDSLEDTDDICDDQILNTTNVQIDLGLQLDRITIYLFSQGILIFFLRQIQNLFKKKMSANQNSSSSPPSSSTATLYLISKLIGGVDLHNVHDI